MRGACRGGKWQGSDTACVVQQGRGGAQGVQQGVTLRGALEQNNADKQPDVWYNKVAKREYRVYCLWVGLSVGGTTGKHGEQGFCWEDASTASPSAAASSQHVSRSGRRGLAITQQRGAHTSRHPRTCQQSRPPVARSTAGALGAAAAATGGRCSRRGLPVGGVVMHPPVVSNHSCAGQGVWALRRMAWHRGKRRGRGGLCWWQARVRELPPLPIALPSLCPALRP